MLLAHEMSQKELDHKAKQAPESRNGGNISTVPLGEKGVHIPKDVGANYLHFTQRNAARQHAVLHIVKGRELSFAIFTNIWHSSAISLCWRTLCSLAPMHTPLHRGARVPALRAGS